MHEINEITSKQSNCDHFMKIIYIDLDGNSCCSGCDQKLNYATIHATIQKEYAYLKDESHSNPKVKT